MKLVIGLLGIFLVFLVLSTCRRSVEGFKSHKKNKKHKNSRSSHHDNNTNLMQFVALQQMMHNAMRPPVLPPVPPPVLPFSHTAPIFPHTSHAHSPPLPPPLPPPILVPPPVVPPPVVPPPVLPPLPPPLPKVAVMLMTKIAPDIKYWLQWHMDKGVARFYIRVDEAPHLEEDLKAYPNVLVDRAPVSQTAGSDPWWLMSKFNDFGVVAVQRAMQDGIDWLICIDDDELLECQGSLPEVIAKEVPADIKTVVIPNKEAKYAAIPTNGCFNSAKFVECPDEACTAYNNGKGMGRVSRTLRLDGFHRFVDDAAPTAEMTVQGIRVLHYESCNFDAYVDKYMTIANKFEGTHPFPFYDESIQIAKSDVCKEKTGHCVERFKDVFSRYKLA